MSIFELILSIWLVITGIFSKPVDPVEPDNPNQPEQEENDVTYTDSLSIETNGLGLSRLAMSNELAKAVYAHLDDALIQRVESFNDATEVTIKSSRSLSCYRLIQADLDQHICLAFIDEDGNLSKGWQDDLVAQDGNQDIEIERLTLELEENSALELFELLPEADAYGRSDELEVRSSNNLFCEKKLLENEKISCSFDITTNGLVTPKTDRDPIARVGRTLPDIYGQAQLPSLLDLGLDLDDEFSFGLSGLSEYDFSDELEEDDEDEGGFFFP